jgi:hypothetical protein
MSKCSGWVPVGCGIGTSSKLSRKNKLVEQYIAKENTMTMENTSTMLSQEETLKAEIAARNKRQADVLWKILMLMRLVIPAYVVYVIYLYWTMPPSAYLLTGH